MELDEGATGAAIGQAVSSFASTSIEGNPLPLTDVKRILKNKPQNIRDSEREVLNYNEALKEINGKLAQGAIPFTLTLKKSICVFMCAVWVMKAGGGALFSQMTSAAISKRCSKLSRCKRFRHLDRGEFLRLALSDGKVNQVIVGTPCGW
jgi:hypothetical protein